MAEPITKTMPEILIDRMNATRAERIGHMQNAARCAYMEAQLDAMLRDYGYETRQTAEGYRAVRRNG